MSALSRAILPVALLCVCVAEVVVANRGMWVLKGKLMLPKQRECRKTGLLPAGVSVTRAGKAGNRKWARSKQAELGIQKTQGSMLIAWRLQPRGI